MQEADRLATTTAPDSPDGPTKDPLLGTVLLKRYEVIEQIGTGRFSVVYKARQLLMNRLVAIKSLKRDLLDEKEVVQRFKKEARALSRLRHPNIVAVFDCFESQNGRPYLVMDY
ncbi:MAG TPA: protein kinase, partial [Trichormus sp.]